MRELCRSQPGWDCRALAAAGAEVWRLEGTPQEKSRPAAPGPGQVEALFCRRGGLQLERSGGQRLPLRPGQVLLLGGSAEDCLVRFCCEPFQGILVAMPEQAARALPASLCPGLGGLPAGIGHGARVVTAVLWGEAFFHTLEQLPESEQGTYCALKTGELFFLLHVGKAALLRPQGERYYDHYQLQAVQGVRDYMRAHLDEHLTIPELAGRFHISATMLKACFRQVYGVPVHQYLLEQRMVQAAELLASTRRSVSAVAAAVGYRGTGQFSTAFRARYRLSPAQYRQAARKRTAGAQEFSQP